MNENRGSWYLLTGLIIGLAFGMLYAWFLNPKKYVETSPASLQQAYKDKYRALIAAAFLSNKDLVRAHARLDLLQDADVYRSLSEQAQRKLADGSSPDEARALGVLAVAIGQATPAGQVTADSQSLATSTIGTVKLAIPPSSTPFATLVFTPTVITPATITPTSTPTSSPPTASNANDTQLSTPNATPTRTSTRSSVPTITAFPTQTPSSTPGAPFVLQDRQKNCDQQLEQPALQVEAIDSTGQPVPGVEIVVTWEGGEQHFYTGLKPEVSLGYADLTLTPGVVYALRLSGGGQPVNDLDPVECQGANGGQFWGAWHLKFVQP